MSLNHMIIGVTGAGGHLGAAITLDLASFGATVIAMGRTLERLEAVEERAHTEELAGEVIPLVCDVLSEEDIDLALRMHTAPLPVRDDLVARTVRRGTLELYACPEIADDFGAEPTMAQVETRAVLAHASAWRALWSGPPAVLADDFAPIATCSCKRLHQHLVTIRIQVLK